MTKRKTNAQREAEQRSALFQRVYDVVSGACGRVLESQDSIECEWLVPDELSRAVPALKEMFSGDQALDAQDKPTGDWENDHLFELHYLDRFTSVGSITDFLFEHGVRA